MGLCDSPLALVLDVCRRRSGVHIGVVTSLHVEASLVLLLLHQHLLFDLLLVHLLSRCQIEIVNDIGDVGYSIVVLSISDLANSIFSIAGAIFVLRIDNALGSIDL